MKKVLTKYLRNLQLTLASVAFATTVNSATLENKRIYDNVSFNSRYIEKIDFHASKNASRTIYVIFQKPSIDKYGDRQDRTDNQISIYRIIENLYSKGTQVILSQGISNDNKNDLEKRVSNYENNQKYKDVLRKIEKGDDRSLSHILSNLDTTGCNLIGLTYNNLFLSGFEELDKNEDVLNYAIENMKDLTKDEINVVLNYMERKNKSRTKNSIKYAQEIPQELKKNGIISSLDSIVVIDIDKLENFDEIIAQVKKNQTQYNLSMIYPKGLL